MSQVAKTPPTSSPATVAGSRPVAPDGRGVGLTAPAFAPVEEVSALSATGSYGDSTVLSQGYTHGGSARGEQRQPAPPPDDSRFRTTSQVFATLLETGQIAGERRRDGDRILPQAVRDRAINAYQTSARINTTLVRTRARTLY